MIDRMNYHCADWVYRKHRLEESRLPGAFPSTLRALVSACKSGAIACRNVS